MSSAFDARNVDGVVANILQIGVMNHQFVLATVNQNLKPKKVK